MTTRLGILTLACVVALAACGDDTSGPTTTEPAAANTSVTVSTTPASTGAGTSLPSTAPSPSSTTIPPTTTVAQPPSTSVVSTSTTVPPDSTSSVPATTEPEPDRLPPAVGPVHGGTFWAVYLVVVPVAEYDESDFTLAEDAALTAGYVPTSGDLACDEGAIESLGLDPAVEYFALAIYFAGQADAETFAAAFGPGVAGIAQVITYCLD